MSPIWYSPASRPPKGDTTWQNVASIVPPLVVALATLSAASSSLAQEQASSDPTASLTSFQLQDLYAPGFHRLDDVDQDLEQFRMAVPCSGSGVDHIARLTDGGIPVRACSCRSFRLS